MDKGERGAPAPHGEKSPLKMSRSLGVYWYECSATEKSLTGFELTLSLPV